MQFCSFLFFLSWPFKDAFHSFIYQSICSFNCLYILLFFLFTNDNLFLISSRFTLLSSDGCLLLFFLSFILTNFLTVAVNVSYNVIHCHCHCHSDVSCNSYCHFLAHCQCYCISHCHSLSWSLCWCLILFFSLTLSAPFLSALFLWAQCNQVWLFLLHSTSLILSF